MGMSGLMTGDKATRLHMIQCPVAKCGPHTPTSFQLNVSLRLLNVALVSTTTLHYNYNYTLHFLFLVHLSVWKRQMLIRQEIRGHA